MLLIEEGKITLFLPKKHIIDNGICAFCGEKKASITNNKVNILDPLLGSLKKLLIGDSNAKLCAGCNTSFHHHCNNALNARKRDYNYLCDQPFCPDANGFTLIMPNKVNEYNEAKESVSKELDELGDKLNIYGEYDDSTLYFKTLDKMDRLENKYMKYTISKEGYSCNIGIDYLWHLHIMNYKDDELMLNEISTNIMLKLLDRTIEKERIAKKYGR